MEDLDPRRFEDLIRQLVHRFRPWRLLEPTGKLGNDDGIDIRGEEVVAVREPTSIASDEINDDSDGTTEETRVWRIQCKRYKRLHPKGVVSIVSELVRDADKAPYGVLIAAAADVSADSLAAFHARAIELGVCEHHFLSRSIIEDLLYRPENDHLLFAYFGISLQARRRSAAASIRATVTLKKQLRALLEEEDDAQGRLLLLRDIGDTR